MFPAILEIEVHAILACVPIKARVGFLKQALINGIILLDLFQGIFPGWGK
jgi:hypothetical protein